jgi:hypothetical protein
MNFKAGTIIVEGVPSNPRWTGVVVIKTSIIAIHTFEERGESFY